MFVIHSCVGVNNFRNW